METNNITKTVLITGATRGIGFATAAQMAQLGWNVVIVGRSRARIDSALAALRAQAPQARVEGLLGDLANRADVRRVAEDFRSAHPLLDVLINNVGATMMRYTETAEGLESTWALNYLNHFALSHLLLDSLTSAAQAAGEARVMEIGSTMERFASNDYTKRPAQRRYNGVLAYSYSKRAMLLFTQEAARRWSERGIAINTLAPGFVATNVAAENALWTRWIMAAIRRFSLPVDEGAKPVARLAADPALRGVTGKYFHRFTQLEIPPRAQDPAAAQALWEYSLRETQV